MSGTQSPFTTIAAALQHQQQQSHPSMQQQNPTMAMTPQLLSSMFGGLNPALLAAQAAQYGMQFPGQAGAASPVVGAPMAPPNMYDHDSYPNAHGGYGMPPVSSPMQHSHYAPHQQQPLPTHQSQMQGMPNARMAGSVPRRSDGMPSGAGMRGSDDRGVKRARRDGPAGVGSGATGAAEAADEGMRRSDPDFQFPSHSLTASYISPAELAEAFPQLIIAQDCLRVERSWLHSLVPSYRAQTPAPWMLPTELPLGSRPLIEIMPYRPDGIEVPAVRPSRLAPSSPDALPRRFSSKVMFVSVDPAMSQHTNTTARDLLVAAHLRFLVSTKTEGQGVVPMLLGGTWNAEQDGADPLADGGRALIRTATRAMREQTGIDLSRVRMWTKFCEFEYHRPVEVCKGKSYEEELETTVVWLVNVNDVSGAPADFLELWTRYEITRIAEHPTQSPAGHQFSRSVGSASHATLDTPQPTQPEPATLSVVSVVAASGQQYGVNQGDAPRRPRMLACSMFPEKSQLRLMSLDALLEYNTRATKSEKAFEVHVCAELFRELLTMRHGLTIITMCLAEMRDEPLPNAAFSLQGLLSQMARAARSAPVSEIGHVIDMMSHGTSAAGPASSSAAALSGVPPMPPSSSPSSATELGELKAQPSLPTPALSSMALDRLGPSTVLLEHSGAAKPAPNGGAAVVAASSPAASRSPQPASVAAATQDAAAPAPVAAQEEKLDISKLLANLAAATQPASSAGAAAPGTKSLSSSAVSSPVPALAQTPSEPAGPALFAGVAAPAGRPNGAADAAAEPPVALPTTPVSVSMSAAASPALGSPSRGADAAMVVPPVTPELRVQAYIALRFFDRMRHRYLRLGQLEEMLLKLDAGLSPKAVFDLLRTRPIRMMNRKYFEETANPAANMFNANRVGPGSATFQRYMGKRCDVRLWYEDGTSKLVFKD